MRYTNRRLSLLFASLLFGVTFVAASQDLVLDDA